MGAEVHQAHWRPRHLRMFVAKTPVTMGVDVQENATSGKFVIANYNLLSTILALIQIINLI